jgi:hypothetical protein
MDSPTTRRRQGFSSLVLSPATSKRVRRSPRHEASPSWGKPGANAFPAAPVDPMALPPSATFKTTPTPQSPSRKRATQPKSPFAAAGGGSGGGGAKTKLAAKKERNNKKLGKKSSTSSSPSTKRQQSSTTTTVCFASSPSHWEIVEVMSRTVSGSIRGGPAPSPMLRPMPAPRGAMPAMLQLPNSLCLEVDTEFMLDEMLLDAF